MKISRHILTALAALSLAPAAYAYDLDFDSGVDVISYIGKVQAQQSDIRRPPREFERRRWWDSDCVAFTTKKSGEVEFSPYWLESVYKVEVCREYYEEDHHGPSGPGGNHGPSGPGGNHGPSGPGGNHGPSGGSGTHGGHGGHGGPFRADDYSASDFDPSRGMRVECRTRELDRVRKAVSMVLQDRKLFPWESEKITACLENQNVSLYEKQVSYEYSAKVASESSSSKHYVLTPVRRLPTPPDPEGMSVKTLEYAGGAFRFVFADKWSEYYPNEKTKLKVTLIRNRTLWFDKKVVTKEFSLDVSPEYLVEFEQTEGVKDGTYHIKWSFVRDGDTSTGDEVDMGRSEKESDFEVRQGKVFMLS